MSSITRISVYEETRDQGMLRFTPTAWIEVEKVSPGTFKIINDSLTQPDIGELAEYALVAVYWDNEVENRDFVLSSSFDASEDLRWHDVEITPLEIRAPSIEQIREALRHVVFAAWCPNCL